MPDYVPDISFCAAVNGWLSDLGISELPGSGRDLPLVDADWDTCCYICLWAALDRKTVLPDSLYSRMVLGEPTRWADLYLRWLDGQGKTG